MLERSEVLELPVGYYNKSEDRWFKKLIVQKLDSEDLMVIGDKKSRRNPYQVFVSLLSKGVVSIQDDEGEELPNFKKKIRFLYWVDALYSLIELVCITKGETKTVTAYRCPNCREFTKYDFVESDEEEDDDGEFIEVDDREDFRNMKCVILSRKDIESKYPGGVHHYKVKTGFRDRASKLQIKGYNVALPTLQTYIDVWNYTENPLEQEKEALWRSVEGVDGHDEKQFISLKTKYGRKLFLPDNKEYARLKRRFRRIGYWLDDHKVKCNECMYEFETKFDLSNFFGSILPM